MNKKPIQEKCKNGCDKKVKRIGLCSTCYNKKLKQDKIERGQLCQVDGCIDVEFSKGFCSRHYKQMYRHGKTFRTLYEDNDYIIDGKTTYIKIYNNGEYSATSIIDTEDIDIAKQYNWHINKGGYVTYKSDTMGHIFLHRLVTKCEEDKIVDHINRNPLDNRKENLRICTQTENMQNKSIQSNNKSGHAGVFYYDKINKWGSRITVNKKNINLGYFESIEDAIKIRKEAEERYFAI